MTKTLEILQDDVTNIYKIVSPDHEQSITVDAYTLDLGDGVTSLVEDGRHTVDVAPDKYFHIDEDGNLNHATISVEKHPQGPREYYIPYEAAYTPVEMTRGDVTGMPESDKSKEVLYNLSDMELIIEYCDGRKKIVGVVVDGRERRFD